MNDDRQLRQRQIGQFVETFALTLADAGFPRMPARVFSALLVRDDAKMDAQQIAEALQISPAAVSGAIRYLIQVKLVHREREVGARRDNYRLQSDVWYEALAQRDAELARFTEQTLSGARAVGPDSPAGRRLADTAAFFEFLAVEMRDLTERWRQQRASTTD